MVHLHSTNVDYPGTIQLLVNADWEFRHPTYCFLRTSTVGVSVFGFSFYLALPHLSVKLTCFLLIFIYFYVFILLHSSPFCERFCSSRVLVNPAFFLLLFVSDLYFYVHCLCIALFTWHSNLAWIWSRVRLLIWIAAKRLPFSIHLGTVILVEKGNKR